MFFPRASPVYEENCDPLPQISLNLGRKHHIFHTSPHLKKINESSTLHAFYLNFQKKNLKITKILFVYMEIAKKLFIN